MPRDVTRSSFLLVGRSIHVGGFGALYPRLVLNAAKAAVISHRAVNVGRKVFGHLALPVTRAGGSAFFAKFDRIPCREPPCRVKPVGENASRSRLDAESR